MKLVQSVFLWILYVQIRHCLNQICLIQQDFFSTMLHMVDIPVAFIRTEWKLGSFPGMAVTIVTNPKSIKNIKFSYNF